MALATREAKLALILPRENAREAAVVQGLELYSVDTLAQVVDFLAGRTELTPTPPLAPEEAGWEPGDEVDFKEVRGQEPVKRALLLAAAGGHNVLIL